MITIRFFLLLILQCFSLMGWAVLNADSEILLNGAPILQAPVACLPLDADRPATEHIIRADVDYQAKTIAVFQRTRFVNRTGDSLSELVFNVEPNQEHGVFTLVSVHSDNQPLEHTLSGKRLTVHLPTERILGGNCTVTLQLEFLLNVPQSAIGGQQRRGFFNATPRQMNLGGWLPTVAPYADGDWITRDAYRLGEQDILDVADWDVTLRFNPQNESLRVAAAGLGGQLAPDMWRFTHHRAREIAISISDQFRMESSLISDGVSVETYTLGHVPDVTAHHFHDVSAQSLALFSQLFSPYMNERLVVVQGDFPDGMEFDGLMFVGDSWFTNWNGRPTSYLTLITIHEVAHQWWYARVANDAAFTPWLDEALATYSEYLYLEYYHPDLTDWWWQFRVDNFAPQGFVDSSVYEFQTGREYINAVYLQGARMLHDLRRDLGDDAFFALLRNYAETYAGDIATSDGFWALLTPEQRIATAETRARYMRSVVETTN